MATVYGNLQRLKASHIKQLERLYDERLPSDRFITPELAEQFATLSQTTPLCKLIQYNNVGSIAPHIVVLNQLAHCYIHHPICCYVNRRGQVVRSP